MPRYKIALCVVSYNGANDLPACLESIRAQSFSDFQLVVVDNASSDESVQIAQRVVPDARLITLSQNLGFTGGYNTAIRATDAEYVVVVNQDARLVTDFCERVVMFFDAHPEVGSVNPQVLRTSQDLLTNEAEEVTIDTCGLKLSRRHRFENIGEGALPETELTSREIWGVCAAVAVYRMSALADVAEGVATAPQYFDEDFFMYQEDIDLAYRLKWRGWQAWYLADLVAYHGRTRKSGAPRTNQQINYWSYRNHWYVLIKNLSVGMLMYCFLDIVWYEFLKLLYRGVWERGWFREFGDIWTHRAQLMQKRRYILEHRTIEDIDMYAYVID